MYFVNQRWLGGMLTNYKTISGRIKRLNDIKAMEEDGTFEKLSKKEVIKLRLELEKLEKFLGGIKDMKGMPAAREAILQYHLSRGLKDITADDIFIGNGVSEVASMLMTALMGSEDEILMPTPCYSLWSNSAYICGAKPVYYRCDPNNGWNPDVADIRGKITEKTKAILIINPNNPTGAVYSREVLLEIAELARKHHLVLLSDEIYDRLVMDGLEHISTASLAPDLFCVTFSVLSKSCFWVSRKLMLSS